jgi:hypothetical protein
LMTAEDVVVRVGADGVGRGVGLRGGSFDVQLVASGYRAQLREVRWTEDVSVSGTVDWPARRGDGPVKANLELAGWGRLQVQWVEGAVATARGELRGKTVVAEAPAP